MDDRYEPLSPDTSTEEMLTTPRPVIASPSVTQESGNAASRSRVLARIPEVRRPKSPPKSEPTGVGEAVKPLSPIRQGFSRWFLVGIAASLLLLIVVPLAIFNNGGPEHSNDVPSWVSEQPAPNASPAPAWNNTPSPIDSQRQVGEPQTRIVDSLLPGNAHSTWQNPTSTPSSWQSPQPVATTPSPQYNKSTQQRYQMANRPLQANAMRPMSIGGNSNQQFAPRQNNRSAYRYQPGSTNSNYRVPPASRVEGTGVTEPGVASFKGVIEKPTIRTMNDRTRPSLY